MPDLTSSHQSSQVYQIVGSDGSPYSCKMRAYMRYRRIPFKWVPPFMLENNATYPIDGPAGNIWDNHFQQLKARVMPILIRPDGSYANDSTPLIVELEETFTQRPTFPKSPAIAFLTALIEDFADEWGTKLMYEGRFHTARDADFSARWQYLQNPKLVADPNIAEEAAAFAEHQRRRRSIIVGSTFDLFEGMTRSLCAIYGESLAAGNLFLFGDYPTNADFGLFGQMRQLAMDPLPAGIMHDTPEVWAWVWTMDDLSGHEPEGGGDSGLRSTDIPAAAMKLLKFIAECYLPFLAANDQALSTGESEVKVRIFGGEVSGLPQVEHRQPPFKYQQRCLKALQAQHDTLQGSDKDLVREVLTEAGGLWLFEGNVDPGGKSL